MPTPKQMAEGYANDLRQVQRTHYNRVVVAKSETAAQVATAELVQAVNGILQSIETLVYERNKKRVSLETRQNVRELIDDELGVQKGTMELIQKGSVKMSLEYHRTIMHLMSKITYR